MHLLGDDPFGAVGGHRAELVRGLDNLWVTLPTWHTDDPRARAGAVQWTARDDEKGLANGLRRGEEIEVIAKHIAHRVSGSERREVFQQQITFFSQSSAAIPDSADSGALYFFIRLSGRATHRSRVAMDKALRENMEAQRDRLLDQLTDLEELKDELEPEEYEESKKDTIEQLKEFEASLQKMTKGDMTLDDSMTATRLAIRAAISDAFKTPEVIRLFAKKEPAALRRRLAELDRDVKLGKLDEAQTKAQKLEILVALKKLKEPLDAAEEAFLKTNMTTSMSEFEAVADDSGDVKNFPGSSG